MASWQMRGVGLYTRLAYRRAYATEEAGRRKLARAKGPSAPPKTFTRRFDVTSSSVHGFTVYRVSARTRSAGDQVATQAQSTDRPVVIYLHGGAYTSEIVQQHWSLIGHIAEHTGYQVLVPLYGLSPAHHGLQALELVTEVIRGAGARCYLAGDSSGGGLALLAAQAAGGSTGGVAGLTLLAPWLDLTMSNPGIDAIEPHDPWLARPGLRPIADAWAGGLALDDHRLSPIHGALDGLPPLQILVGTRDITLADCRTLRDMLPAGVDLTYHEQAGALHVYPLLPVPEAVAGRRAIVRHIRGALDAPASR